MRQDVETLVGPELDYWVARAEGFYGGDLAIRPVYGCSYYDGSGLRTYSPSTRWELAGEIISREQISIVFEHIGQAEPWHAHYSVGSGLSRATYSLRGRTPQEAAMRAYICKKLGSVIDSAVDSTPIVVPAPQGEKRQAEKLPAVVELDQDRQDAWL